MVGCPCAWAQLRLIQVLRAPLAGPTAPTHCLSPGNTSTHVPPMCLPCAKPHLTALISDTPAGKASLMQLGLHAWLNISDATYRPLQGMHAVGHVLSCVHDPLQGRKSKATNPCAEGLAQNQDQRKLSKHAHTTHL